MKNPIDNGKYHIREVKESDIEHVIEMRMALESYLDSCNPNLWRVSSYQITKSILLQKNIEE
ncbi:MAG: hypothetical protein XD91_0775 [Clostridiales bacterium 38_11]|nr:MAG: hypothetical protein XD91_0775 [Clostridiales bacterium 38_11]